MAKDNLTKVANIDVSVREIDFVTRFAKNWDALKNIMGITRAIKKVPGTKLVAYTASVTLQPGNVGEGEDIPYSLAQVIEAAYGDVTIEKYAKAVSIEAVNKYGAEVAVQKTDDEFLNQLQGNVLAKFYTFLNTGSLVDTADSFQAALAKAKGSVVDKFQDMDRSVTDVIGFCNTLDAYDYIGAANITVQTQFGLTYIKDFLGYSTLFLLPAKYIARGKVIAVPVENIDLYYVDPNDSDFKKLGLSYTVDGVTNLIGFHVNGNYNTAVGESFALMGLTLWAEFLDGIAVVSVNSGNLTSATVTPADSGTDYWGTTAGQMQSGVSVANGAITGTLNNLTSGQLVTDWGEGHFIALKFDNFSSGLTYSDVKVGLHNSEGAGLVTLDSDKDGVFKITDKNNQKLMVVQSKNGATKTQYFDLSGLTLA